MKKSLAARYLISGLNREKREVSVLFCDKNLDKTYKFVEFKELIEKVEKGESICLNNCYVENFSFSKLFKVSKDNLESECNEKNISHGHTLINFEARNTFFYGNTDFSGANFSGETTVFNNSIFFTNYVNFSNSVFESGNVSFNDVDFGGGTTNFKNADFGNGNLTFQNALFYNKEVTFKGTNFNEGNVSFDHAKFGEGNINLEQIKTKKGTISFWGTCFDNGNLHFLNSDFSSSNLFFSDTSFKKGDIIISFANVDDGQICFNNVNFEEGKIVFSGTKFNKSLVDFYNVNFVKEQIYIDDIISNHLTLFFHNSIINTPLDINLDHIKTLVFYGCTNTDLINLKSSKSNYVKNQIALFNMNNMGFLQLDWDKNKYSIMKFDTKMFSEDIKYPINIKKFIEDCKENLGRLKAKELCMLKEIYHNQGMYDWEDATYVQFKILDTILLSNKHFIKKPVFFILYIIGQYGTNPFSVFITMLLTVIICAAFYYTPFAQISKPGDDIFWWSPLYYSIITFFTIGYGDLSAHNWLTAAFCGAEGFLGVFLMSYFSVALVRKILR